MCIYNTSHYKPALIVHTDMWNLEIHDSLSVSQTHSGSQSMFGGEEANLSDNNRKCVLSHASVETGYDTVAGNSNLCILILTCLF